MYKYGVRSTYDRKHRELYIHRLIGGVELDARQELSIYIHIYASFSFNIDI